MLKIYSVRGPIFHILPETGIRRILGRQCFLCWRSTNPYIDQPERFSVEELTERMAAFSGTRCVSEWLKCDGVKYKQKNYSWHKYGFTERNLGLEHGGIHWRYQVEVEVNFGGAWRVTIEYGDSEMTCPRLLSWALGTGVARTLRTVDMREVVGSIPTVSTFLFLFLTNFGWPINDKN